MSYLCIVCVLRSEGEPVSDMHSLSQKQRKVLDPWVKTLFLCAEGERGLTESERCVRIWQDPMGDLGFGIGATIWDCALAMIAHLEWIAHNNFRQSRRVCIEIGSGTGAVGLCAHKLLRSEWTLLTDQMIAVPLLNHNARVNTGNSNNSSRVSVMPLDWTKECECNAVCNRIKDECQKMNPSKDANLQIYLLMSDVICFESLYQSLMDTLDQIICCLNQLSPFQVSCVMTFEQRKPLEEKKFFQMIEKRDWKYRIIPSTLIDVLEDSHWSHFRSPEIKFCLIDF